MPTRKKTNIGKYTKKVKRDKMNRLTETPYDRENRLNTNQALETPNSRENRLELNRLRNRESRAAETLNQYEIRLQINRERASTSRQTMRSDLKLESFNYNRETEYRYKTII